MIDVLTKPASPSRHAMIYFQTIIKQDRIKNVPNPIISEGDAVSDAEGKVELMISGFSVGASLIFSSNAASHWSSCSREDIAGRCDVSM